MQDMEDIKSVLVSNGLIPLVMVPKGEVARPGERPFELFEVTLAVAKALDTAKKE